MLPVVTVLTAFSPGEAVYGTGIPNPLAVEALRPVADVLRLFSFPPLHRPDVRRGGLA